MKLEIGELIELDSDESYVILNKIMFNNEEYLVLVTATPPVKISIAQELEVDGELSIEVIEDPEVTIGVLEELAKLEV